MKPWLEMMKFGSPLEHPVQSFIEQAVKGVQLIEVQKTHPALSPGAHCPSEAGAGDGAGGSLGRGWPLQEHGRAQLGLFSTIRRKYESASFLPPPPLWNRIRAISPDKKDEWVFGSGKALWHHTLLWLLLHQHLPPRWAILSSYLPEMKSPSDALRLHEFYNSCCHQAAPCDSVQEPQVPR